MPINCNTTPFGLFTPLAQDIEGINLIESTAASQIDEYQPASNAIAPFLRSFRVNRPAALNGATLQRAVNIDLDGNGRDEVVAAYKLSTGTLRLAVYKRLNNNVQLLDTWSINRTFSHVELAAGDLNGSTDGRQELGVMLRSTSGAISVFVLQGDSAGAIAQADEQSAGSWTRSGPVGISVGFTAGDLLLSGHEQLMVVSELNPGSARQFAYDLLEFEPSTSLLPVTSPAVNIGSKTFTSNVGATFGGSFNSILRIEADAGDIVDTAAAELVLHIQHREGSFDYITQRMLHFPTTRDNNNQITGISLFDRTPNGPPDDNSFDSSQIIQQQNADGPASFEATIAQVDRSLFREIVIARSNPSGSLTVAAYQPTVDRKVGFTFLTTGTTVNFRNTSTGGALGYSWDFGDGTGAIPGVDVTHQYAANGTYNVRVTANYAGGISITQNPAISVVVSASASSGGITPIYSYSVGAPKYSAAYQVANYNDLSYVNIAAGDMNRDGNYEILTVAQNIQGRILRSRWQLGDPDVPASFGGLHAEESNALWNNLTTLELVGSDFDGDSLYGTLGNQCVRTYEPQMRQVVWLPPHFGVEQANAEKLSSWGQSTTGTSSQEKRSGSYMANDVSGYIGIGIGTPEALPYSVGASVKFTAGRNWQRSKGEIHAEESSLTVDQGYQQSQGEALTITEENAFDCYRYDVKRAASGLDADSAMRMCAPVENSRLLSASDAREWDTAVPASGVQLLGHKPAQWFPLQRDWASISLFKSVTTNTAFQSGHGANSVTDGSFDSEALAGGARVNPYVEIDLGKVQDISNIRIFPAAGDAIDLKDFRLYASRTPMPSTGVPAGLGISSFVNETGDQVSYDRWNVWTRNPSSPSQMLRARYIRLQHPGPLPATLRVAEIQVFGDVHIDPPFYPEAVCDPVANDGRYKALVWNKGTSGFLAVDVRGDLIWDGSVIPPTSGFAGCTNHGGVPSRNIWNDIAVGASGSNTWNLSSESGSLTGNFTSFDNSTRVGAEFDFEAGFMVKVLGGAAYEYTTGITEETQNSTYWGQGLEIGGVIGGFTNPALGTTCRYRPRPYAYRLPDRSDTGYLHVAYAVDYIVQESGASFWKRANVPAVCFGDRIFADGFD